MSIICLMLFVTICVLASSLSIKNSMTANLEELAPVDVEFCKIVDIEIQKEAVISDFNLSIAETLENNGFDVTNKLKDRVSFNIYKTKEVTLKDTLGDSLEEIKNKHTFMRYENMETIIGISDYNKIAKLFFSFNILERVL